MSDKIDATEFSLKSLKEDAARLKIPRSGRAKAIRAKCLDCCAGSSIEVARCHITACALWPFRFGTDPFSERVGNPNGAAALAEYRARKAAE